MRVVVVVADVVGVVAARRRPRDELLQHGLQVRDPARLVLHRRHRRRRAGHEHAHDPVRHAALAHDREHALGEVDDLALPLRLEPQNAAVDAHATRSRRKRRLPTCSTRPCNSAAGTSSADTGCPSSFTPPAAIVRRASEREPPNTSAISSGRCTSPLPGTTASSISVGSSRAWKTRRNSSAAASASARPWNRSTSACASACLASRGGTSAGWDRPSSSSYHCPSALSGSDSVLPYISPGGSVIPMSLPSDFDILCTPSSPGRIGIV